MGHDLSGMTRKELINLRDKVDAAIKTAEQRERQEALKAAEKAAAEFGFSLAELSGETRKSTKGTKAQPKYRNPANPEQTWSGRGRKPQWVHDAIQSGADISDLEI
ncbi:H-NS histone family protein [Ruegeria pomeroyi]|uniref:H-NS histone family protein n=1 Tax=Ruegeria alba TaxID=2916756 RepID=A0ABS9NTF4_9RHOB|nr:H-NS histone family protein [Ruegeria alba]MCE8512123.1 H-NS histone family protein [Ruegeria pomeroyi]MCE8520693.1 H-NS histone family protein [Ruegeria pomeroyi]MCE8528705.1 H-NS histone family protein [Ruegeria pomeroyi]MCE8532874.1 H-NS histone family protein [Ruegeria pomeroyi]MCG6557498.1 H-NS histone family protein [Ruegeria alba]